MPLTLRKSHRVAQCVLHGDCGSSMDVDSAFSEWYDEMAQRKWRLRLVFEGRSALATLPLSATTDKLVDAAAHLHGIDQIEYSLRLIVNGQSLAPGVQLFKAMPLADPRSRENILVFATEKRVQRRAYYASRAPMDDASRHLRRTFSIEEAEFCASPSSETKEESMEEWLQSMRQRSERVSADQVSPLSHLTRPPPAVPSAETEEAIAHLSTSQRKLSKMARTMAEVTRELEATRKELELAKRRLNELESAVQTTAAGAAHTTAAGEQPPSGKQAADAQVQEAREDSAGSAVPASLPAASRPADIAPEAVADVVARMQAMMAAAEASEAVAAADGSCRSAMKHAASETAADVVARMNAMMAAFEAGRAITKQ